MADLPLITTDRLELRPADPSQDLDALFALMSDPTQWTHAPESRHVDRETTRAWIERAAARWQSDGLSYWTVRSRTTAEVVGLGGAQRQSTRAWNLLWRIDATQQRLGLASELGAAAIGAAHATDDSVPVIAWILGHNLASVGVARRLGLADNGLRTDPSDGLSRVAFSDRPLDARYGQSTG